jgi:hypothetical protein
MSVAKSLKTLPRLKSLHDEADHLARAAISTPANASTFAAALRQKLLEQERLLDELKRQIEGIEEAE